VLTKIQKWGNSQGLRFPKTTLEQAHVRVGNEVYISVQEGKIIVEPFHRVRDKYSIQELVALMPEGYRLREVDWGTPAGKEVW